VLWCGLYDVTVSGDLAATIFSDARSRLLHLSLSGVFSARLSTGVFIT
jgi:hypothetical protein